MFLKKNICISVKAVDIQWTMFLHSTTEKKMKSIVNLPIQICIRNLWLNRWKLAKIRCFYNAFQFDEASSGQLSTNNSLFNLNFKVERPLSSSIRSVGHVMLYSCSKLVNRLAGVASVRSSWTSSSPWRYRTSESSASCFCFFWPTARPGTLRCRKRMTSEMMTPATRAAPQAAPAHMAIWPPLIPLSLFSRSISGSTAGP